jgi:hypothetical protein
MVAGTFLLFSFPPAAAQVADTRGQRPEFVYGEQKHYVTLMFYSGQLDITNSTISHLGFLLAGLSEEEREGGYNVPL